MSDDSNIVDVPRISKDEEAELWAKFREKQNRRLLAWMEETCQTCMYERVGHCLANPVAAEGYPPVHVRMDGDLVWLPACAHWTEKT